MKDKGKRYATFYLDVDDLELIKDHKERTGLSKSVIVAKALQLYIEKESQKEEKGY